MADGDEVGAATVPLAAGQPAPDFQLQSIEGRPLALADLRGRRVVLWLSRGIY